MESTFTSREDIVKQIEQKMVIDIPSNDPIWHYHSESTISQNSVQLNFDMSSRLLYDRYLVEGLRNSGVAGTSSRYLDNRFLQYEPLRPGRVHFISIIGKGSTSKPVSGDGLKITSKLVEEGETNPSLSKISVEIGILDGQTIPLLLDNKAIEYAKRFVLSIEGAQQDQIPLIICKELEPIIRLRSYEFSKILLDKGFSEYEVEHLIYQLKYYAPEKDTNKALASWKYSNLALTLAYGGFKKDAIEKDVEIGNVPGFTGTFIHIDESRDLDLSISGLADSPLFLVYESGYIHPAYIQSNGKYDRKTVFKMRDLISKGVVKDAKEAVEKLREDGHYAESFKEKMNNNRGNVAVCNGYKFFPNYAHSNLPLLTNTGGLLAVIGMTDGFTNPFTHYKKGLDKQGAISLIKKLLLNEPVNQLIPWIKNIEQNGYLDNRGLPTHENESDDLEAATILMHPLDHVKNVLSDPKFLFML